MRIQIDQGRVGLPGFVIVGIRPPAESDDVGHAGVPRRVVEGAPPW